MGSRTAGNSPWEQRCGTVDEYQPIELPSSDCFGGNCSWKDTKGGFCTKKKCYLLSSFDLLGYAIVLHSYLLVSITPNQAFFHHHYLQNHHLHHPHLPSHPPLPCCSSSLRSGRSWTVLRRSRPPSPSSC